MLVVVVVGGRGDVLIGYRHVTRETMMQHLRACMMFGDRYIEV